MNFIQIAAVLLIALTAMLFSIGFVKNYMLKRICKKMVFTNALISDAEKRISYTGRQYYKLLIEYKLAGKEIFYLAQTLTSKKYSKGEYLPLMYLLNNPQEFETDFGKRWKRIVMLSVLFLFTVGSIYWVIV